MNASEWRSLLAAGRQAMDDGHADTAVARFEQALALAPGRREIRYWLGNALRLAGRAQAAEQQFRDLLVEHPGDADTHFALAFLLREQGRGGDAALLLTDLARHDDAAPELLLKITGFLRDSNRFEEAIATLRLVMRQAPGDPSLAFRLARLHQATGRFDKALEAVRDALTGDPSLGGAWLSLAHLQRFEDPDHADLRRLRAAVDAPAGREAAMCIAFALGKAHDDLGDWRQAWDWYRRGNRLRHAEQAWDRDACARERQSARTQACPVPPFPAHSGRHPVYIVGMLRSGTTLLERLLDRHPRITARGELNFLAHQARAAKGSVPDPGALHAAGDLLWTQLRQDGDENLHYIDKNPLNFRFLGFLAAALPEARIIHVRRDGRDACLSCYFQLFQHPEAGFANDLDDLVDYHHGYRQLMDHWESVLGARILNVDYEKLAENTAPSLRRILEFLGLDWDDAMDADDQTSRPIRTASTWQARQPVHRASIGRWRNYRAFAPEFFDALAG
ncbi:tetratricopeptide repeat-containing sulfotransferase family protein [Elongatibacter sediminis]|uniref:Sulfotransferase n=1 Tax=Elongatibacter sediminis TaxID=3119006 RepID=A0AAW9RHG8_9GAMM